MIKFKGHFRGGKRTHPRKQKRVNIICGPPVLKVLQLNIVGRSASKICMINQLVTKHKVLMVLLQETHCTNADQLVLPNFTLAGSVSSRKHGLATFVHEKLSWTLADQSPDGLETEWLCVDIDDTKIINVYKPHLATDANNDPGVPIPQPIRRRL